jgi:hypothetical protein
MKTLADTSMSWTEALVTETACSGDDTSGAAIADLAGNTRLTAKGRVVREFYGSVLRQRLPIETNQNLGQPIVTAAKDPLSLRAPILPERTSTSVVSYHALQQWEGYVTSIGAEVFTADLVDITRTASVADEQVELSLEEIGPDHFSEVRVGSVFRWTIGYETLPSGQRRRVSQIVFRQLPRWTRADLDAAKRHAAERHRKINWQ